MNSFFYANIFVLSGWTKFYKVIKPRAQVIFFLCVRTLSRSWDLQAIQDMIVHAVLCIFLSFKKSEAFSLCGFTTPSFILFIFSHSRTPITRSDLEFTASNNCLMDPHVYTAWHRHPEVSLKSPISTTVSCFLPALKKKGKKKREKLQALFFLVLRGAVNGPSVSATGTLSQNFGKYFLHLL